MARSWLLVLSIRLARSFHMVLSGVLARSIVMDLSLHMAIFDYVCLNRALDYMRVAEKCDWIRQWRLFVEVSTIPLTV
jgi:hypothetical protein